MKFKIGVDMGDTPDKIVALLRLDGAKRGVRVAGVYLRGVLGEYPAQPPGVDYARTGNLRNRWTSRPLYGGLRVKVGNNAPYADDVQGSQNNPYFRRVWRDHSIRAVVRRERQKVVGIVQNEVRRSIHA